MWDLGIKPLVQQIVTEIEQSPGKAIPFRDYMEMCLYHPEFGYYMNDREKVGKQGDFYTSSSVGSIMGEMLARYMIRSNEDGPQSGNRLIVVEWGGGTGKLALHMLEEWKKAFPLQYERLQYIIVEQSPYHRMCQLEILAEHLAHVAFMSEKEWYGHGEWENVIVFSNELLDAFPVHRILNEADGLFEIYVAWDDRVKRLYEKLVKIAEGPVLEYVQEHNIVLAEGQTAEINLQADEWIRRVGRQIKSGQLITIDYGDMTREIYSRHRMNGTLLCYRQHRAADNPYQYIGQQDMTAHINFSACIRAGEQADFQEWSLLTQKQFLIEAGILHKLQNHVTTDPFDPVARTNRSIRQILLSDQMSELFKVLIQRKKTAE